MVKPPVLGTGCRGFDSPLSEKKKFNHGGHGRSRLLTGCHNYATSGVVRCNAILDDLGVRHGALLGVRGYPLHMLDDCHYGSIIYFYLH